MICPKCNKEVPVGSNICPSCGKDLTRMRMSADTNAQPPRSNGAGQRPGAQQGARRRPGAAQQNPQALIVAGGLVIVFLVLLVLLFRAIFGGGGDQAGTPGGQQTAIESPSPSPTFKIFGVDVNTPEPITTVDPLANLQIEATPTPAAPTPEPTYETLKKGSTGEDVKRLQEALIALNYLEDGGADGDYGNGTMNAVKEFQKDNGLTADGQAGQQTLSTLYRLYGGDIDTSGTTSSTGSSSTTDTSTLILDQPG